MRENWQIKNFENCINDVTYTTKIQRKDFLLKGKYPIISQEQDLINGYWNNSDDVFKVRKPIIIFGDHTKTLKYVESDFVLGADGVKVLEPIAELESRFFYYFLCSIDLPSLGYARHYKLLKDIKVPIPSASTQKHIVAILDDVIAAITTAKENAEMNLNNARELFESYLQSVTADRQPLGDLVEIKTGKLDANAATENGKYPFFTCSREIFAIDTFAFDCEAILLAGNNAVGDFNVKHYKGKFNAYQRTYVITVNRDARVLYRYLYYQILNSLKEFKLKSVGAGTKFLKLGMIKDLEIALPTITEQGQISAKLDALSEETKKLESIYQQKLAKLEELKKSILQKAFSGELKGAAS